MPVLPFVERSFRWLSGVENSGFRESETTTLSEVVEVLETTTLSVLVEVLETTPAVILSGMTKSHPRCHSEGES